MTNSPLFRPSALRPLSHLVSTSSVLLLSSVQVLEGHQAMNQRNPKLFGPDEKLLSIPVFRADAKVVSDWVYATIDPDLSSLHEVVDLFV